jgi:hypothetical protein
LKKCAVFLWFFHIIFPALVSTLSAEFLLRHFLLKSMILEKKMKKLNKSQWLLGVRAMCGILVSHLSSPGCYVVIEIHWGLV